MAGIIPRASSCRAFDPFGAVAASESATPAAGAFACRACSAFAGLADRRYRDFQTRVAAAATGVENRTADRASAHRCSIAGQ